VGCVVLKGDFAMVNLDLGANEFTFAGDRTQISYLTRSPGPIRPGEEDNGSLEYQGVEGDRTFSGKEIQLQGSPLGTLLTVTLKLRGDTGGLTITVLIPRVIDVTRDNPVTFETIGIKASSRGNFGGAGVDLEYTILPLLATAKKVLMPA
jgi:hypothetical protein